MANNDETYEALREIRNIMDRSARIVSLSGWAGIWVGLSATVGAATAWLWLQKPEFQFIGKPTQGDPAYFDWFTVKLMLLGIATFAVALTGAFYFTWRKMRHNTTKMWNNASRQLLIQVFFPLLAGGVFCVMFIYYGCGMFVVPACLIFYGLALLSGSRHTLSDIRYIGMLDVVLGATSLFFPGFGIIFWVIGFGLLHIVYGLLMWGRYEQLTSLDKNS